MESKNLIALLAAMIVIALSLSAAQWYSVDLLAESPSAETPGEAAPETELSVWIWEDDYPVSKQIYEDYMLLHPNVTIDVTMCNVRDYTARLKSALAAGEAIDVVNIDKAEQLSTMIGEGRLFPLEELISESKFDTSIYSTQFDAIKQDGVAYALPYRFSVFCIAYNKTMFRERGVPFPDDHMTWDELVELARRMTFQRDGEQVYGFNLINRTFDSYCMAFQDGRTLIDDNLDLFARSLRQRVDLVRDGVSISSKAYEGEGRFIRTEFEEERMAMYLTADWTINQMRESYRGGLIDFEFDVAMLPSIDGKRYGHSFGQQSFTAVSRASRRPREAFRLVAHYAGGSGARRFAEGGVLPGVIGDAEIMKLFISDGSESPRNIRAFVDQTTHLVMPALPDIEALNTIFLEEAERACRMEISVDEAMTAIRERRRALMQNDT